MAIDFTKLFGDYTGDSSDSYSLEDSMNDLFDTSSKKDSTFNYVPSTTTDYSDYFDDDFKLKDSVFDSTFNYVPSTTTDYSDYFDDDFKLKDFSGGNLLDDNYLKNLDFSGMDLTDYGFEDTTSTDGIKSLEEKGGLVELLAKIIGGGSKSKGGSSGIVGLSENMLDNDLIKILLGKKLLDDDRKGGSAGYVPIGQEAYGGGGGQPSYQISNIQPALLPGMAYANQPTTFNNTPPGMEAGGLMAIPQGNKGLPNLPQSVRNNMGYMEAGGVASLENMMDGPGDITQAMLEPGEFVMTRKATENLTPEFLYDLMHQAENAGRR